MDSRRSCLPKGQLLFVYIDLNSTENREQYSIMHICKYIFTDRCIFVKEKLQICRKISLLIQPFASTLPLLIRHIPTYQAHHALFGGTKAQQVDATIPDLLWVYDSELLSEQKLARRHQFTFTKSIVNNEI